MKSHKESNEDSLRVLLMAYTETTHKKEVAPNHFVIATQGRSTEGEMQVSRPDVQIMEETVVSHTHKALCS